MLFLPIKFKTSVRISPAELDTNYQERIIEKIREEYEGICSKYGYIKQNTIKMIKRSCGNLQKAYFNGDINFEVVCKAEVCNPVKGSIIECFVKNKNQLGILAESYVVNTNNEKIPILDIIIPIKSSGIISEMDLEQIQIGDSIHVEVMGKKYQDKDKKISVIGRVVNTVNDEEIILSEDEADENEAEIFYDEEDIIEEDIKKEDDEEEEEEEEDDEEEEEDEEEEDELDEDLYEEEEFEEDYPEDEIPFDDDEI